jgi:hypothetical protein
MTTQVGFESARSKFFEWCETAKNQEDLDKDFKQEIAKVKQASEGLISKNMTLYHQNFRFGFSFYYGENEGEKKLVPISKQDANLLLWQLANDAEGSWWPIKDPLTNSFFKPKITVKDLPPPSGSTPTNQYLSDLLKWASFNREGREYSILEALTPYSQKILDCCGKLTYRKIKQLFPDYPEINNH